MKQIFTVIVTFFRRLCHKHLNTIDLLSFYGESLYGFSVSHLYIKTLKEIKSFQNKHIYIIGAIDILKFYEVLFKTLPTIGNEKEQ